MASKTNYGSKEQVRVVDHGNERWVYDEKGHVVQTLKWNRHEDQWDVLDKWGNRSGSIKRDHFGNDVLYNSIGRKVGSFKETGVHQKSYYDAKGKEVARFEKDRMNRLYRTAVEDAPETKENKGTPLGKNPYSEYVNNIKISRTSYDPKSGKEEKPVNYDLLFGCITVILFIFVFMAGMSGR